jgi:hypothetical protein
MTYFWTYVIRKILKKKEFISPDGLPNVFPVRYEHLQASRAYEVLIIRYIKLRITSFMELLDDLQDYMRFLKVKS